jgi:ATP-dependent DNA helicase UvrD/PcrA
MIKPTKEQIVIRDAVELDLLVIAPAGCGKTEAMALRAAGLIERGQVKAPRRVLITTFTNRARDNIKERLCQYVSPSAMRDLLSVANFHGLATRIFKAHANVIGMDPQLLIPDSDWVSEQCRQRGLVFAEARRVQERLRNAKQQPLTDAEVEELLITSGDAVALEIEQQRKSESRLTYDDLPRLAELILTNEVVAELYRQHFAAVIVDEFQDLTLQQLSIVNQIGLHKTTFAGDLAQGIYGFAGAAPDDVLDRIRLQCSGTEQFAESHRSGAR